MPKGDRFKLKADPDDGTTPVAHLLLEAVAIANLNGTEKGLILYLWRQTYGWVKEGKRQKDARIPQDELATRMSTSTKTVYSALKDLTGKNIFIRKELGQGRGYVYRMNTDISTWNSHSIDFQQLKLLARLEENFEGSQKLLPLKEITTPAGQKQETPSVDGHEKTEGSSELLPLKKTSTLPLKKTSGATSYKEILNKYKSIILLDLPANEVKEFLVFKLANYMLANNPKVKIPENLNPWINEIRLMIEIDKRTPEEILKVIEFSQKDSFWWPNILSAGKLRKQFDQLYTKMKQGTGPSPGKKGAYIGTSAAYKPQPKESGSPIKIIDGDAEPEEV